MHEGVRGEPGSLAACIDCHVQPNDKGEIAGIESKEHFCNSCHQYAAVQIDCFQCHADRPEEAIRKAKNPNPTVGHSGGDQQALKDYLELSDIPLNQ